MLFAFLSLSWIIIYNFFNCIAFAIKFFKIFGCLWFNFVLNLIHIFSMLAAECNSFHYRYLVIFYLLNLLAIQIFSLFLRAFAFLIQVNFFLHLLPVLCNAFQYFSFISLSNIILIIFVVLRSFFYIFLLNMALSLDFIP